MSCELPGFFQVPLLDQKDIIKVLPQLKTTSSLRIRIIPCGDRKSSDAVRDFVDSFFNLAKEQGEEFSFEYLRELYPRGFVSFLRKGSYKT